MLMGGLAERCETPCQPRELARCGILVEHAAGHAARQLGLNPGQSGLSLVLVAGLERRLDRLHEGPDSADSRAVDLGALGVALDALLCLRRIRHRIAS